MAIMATKLTDIAKTSIYRIEAKKNERTELFLKRKMNTLLIRTGKLVHSTAK